MEWKGEKEMPVYCTLHLSDLHIGSTYLDSQSLIYKITNDIARNGIKGIRSVLVTGDIFNGPSGSSPELIQEASNFFLTLMSELNADSNGITLTKEDFLFVPGNHDIEWTDDISARWNKYRSFLKTFYGVIPDWYDPDDFSFCRPYPEYKLVFLGFNSCGLEKRKLHDEFNSFCQGIDDAKYLSRKIDKTQLLELLEKENPEKYTDFGEISMQQFSKQRRKMDKLDGYQAVAMFHHHFFLFPDNPNQLGDTDVVRHHSTVVQNLRSMRVKTILHGHKHFDLERPFINDDYYETTDSIIDVFAGGSVGAKGLQQHTFSVIDFYPEHDASKLKQRKFIYREDELAPIKTIQIPPVSKAAQVVRLLELLKNQDYSAFDAYQAAIMSNTHLHRVCSNIIEWASNALTGYSDVFRCLDRDSQHLFCLLYAIARRSLAYISLHSPDEQNNLSVTRDLLSEFSAKYVSSSVPERYECLFEVHKLNHAAKLCAELVDKQDDYRGKQYLAFTMVGIFFADLNLVLTEYADDFYRQISHKVNIKLGPNLFHAHVPAPRITIQSDSDRRSAYVKMWCDDATAHKLAVLFVKEFDLTINKFEDFFKLIGLKLYYLLPQIDKNAALDALDNYNFEAYIPTLLPLLIGDNIYHRKEVFARELVQNSIDAISVREALEGRLSAEDRIIRIFLGKDRNGREIFRITDRGTGMDRYKVERYFTSIGRSFYSGDDYAELNIGYKPISSFGIGFLSSFMVCTEIDVSTRSFNGDKEGLKLHIPNYEGCFFIERDDDAKTGTEITLYLNHSETNPYEIIKYLENCMQDIKYEIRINDGKKDICHIPAHRIRQRRQLRRRFSPLCLFIPFLDNGTVGRLDWKEDVFSGKFAHQDSQGLLIELEPKSNNRNVIVLNSGIAADHSEYLRQIFSEKVSRFLFSNNKFLGRGPLDPDVPPNRYIFNFPSNWIQLDVSREKVVGYSTWMEEQHKESHPSGYLQQELAYALTDQLTALLKSCERNECDIPAICIVDIQNFLRTLIQNSRREFSRWPMDFIYSCQIEFTNHGINYTVCLNRNEPVKDFAVLSDIHKRRKAYASLNSEIISRFHNLFPHPVPYSVDILEHTIVQLNRKLREFNRAGELLFSLNPDDLNLLGYSSLLILCYLSSFSEQVFSWDGAHLSESKTKIETRYKECMEQIRNILLYSMTAGAVERGEAQLFISYEDLLNSQILQRQLIPDKDISSLSV